MDNMLASLDIRDAAVVGLTVFWTLSVFIVRSAKPRRCEAAAAVPDVPVLSR